MKVWDLESLENTKTFPNTRGEIAWFEFDGPLIASSCINLNNIIII